MSKGKGKGGKNRRRGKGDRDGKRELVFKEEMQEYAQVRTQLSDLDHHILS
jgi:translation initiation factor 1A